MKYLMLLLCLTVLYERTIPFFTNSISPIKDWFSILQSIIIVVATLFTAEWTYKTFAHKEKIAELKRLKATIALYHFKLTTFCAQIRENETPDDRELAEKLELAKIHNDLISQATINLYTRPKFRKKIQSIVGKWISNEYIKKMQRKRPSSPPENQIIETWQKFNSEYERVMDLIDQEAKKYI